jgi:protein-tyrosine phosphatase
MRKLTLNIKAAEAVGKDIINNTLKANKVQDDAKCQCNHITGNIYLSSYKKAIDLKYLKDNEFTHVINCAPSSKNFSPVSYEEFKYMSFDMKDEPGFDLSSVIFRFIDYIEENKGSEKSQNRILVHCFEGLSRGPTLIISYLMWKNKWSFEVAHDFVKSKRPCIDLNIGFCSQLKKLSEILLLKPEERLYQIDEYNNSRVINKKDFMTENIIQSKAIIYIKNDYIHGLMLRKSISNDFIISFVELIKKFEGVNQETNIFNFEIDKHCNLNFDEMLKCC